MPRRKKEIQTDLFGSDEDALSKPERTRRAPVRKKNDAKYLKTQQANSIFHNLLTKEFKSYFLTLLAIIILTRIMGALFFSNYVWDSFEYTEKINYIRTEMINGSFTLGDLFGLWVPFYQFLCAIVEYILPYNESSSILIPKLITSLFSIANVLLVMQLTIYVARNNYLALIAGVLVLINPLHFIYSTATLTDLPYTTLVLAGLVLIIKEKWYLSALFIALAAFTRTDGWFLIPFFTLVIYILQKDNRVTGICIAIMVSAIVLWLIVGFSYSGNFLYFFEFRNTYIESRKMFAPQALEITSKNIISNFSSLYAASLPFTMLSIVGMIFSLFEVKKFEEDKVYSKLQEPKKKELVILNSLFLYLVAYYLLVYFSRQQNEFFTRYGLSLLCLSIPLSLYYFKKLIMTSRMSWILVIFISIIGLINFAYQIKNEKEFRWSEPHLQNIASKVKAWATENPNKLIYCDSPIIRVYSTLPRDRFLTSSRLRDSFGLTKKNFDSLLPAKNIGLLVATNFESNLAMRYNPQIKNMQPFNIYNPINVLSKEDQKHVGTYLYSINKPEQQIKPNKSKIRISAN